MENLTKITSVALLLIALGSRAQQSELPKAFYKGCLVTSITGGPSRVLFTTFDNEGRKVNSDMSRGVIDPFIMEYGINDKLGVGFSRGGENYNINANKFYNADVSESDAMMMASTKYLTADLSYHLYSTKRFDVSLFGSLGYFKVLGDCYALSDTSCYTTSVYKYEGKGAIIRGGVRSRYYFSKRFGVMAMLYSFTGFAKEKRKPSDPSDAVNTSGYSSLLTGGGLEFGICFRIFKQKGVIEETKQERRMRNMDASEKTPLIRVVWD
jgi:hypothetical protein